MTAPAVVQWTMFAITDEVQKKERRRSERVGIDKEEVMQTWWGETTSLTVPPLLRQTHAVQS